MMNVFRRSLPRALAIISILALAFNLASAQGTGLTIEPDTLNFQRVRGGDFGQASFTITNTTSASISGTVNEPSGVFRLLSGGGAFTLNASDSMTVTLQFTPSALQLFGDSLSIVYSAGGVIDTAWVYLRGAGTEPGPITVSVSPSALLFGTVAIGDTAELTLRIINTSDSARANGTITGLGGAFSLEGTANFSVAAGDTQEVTVRFAPTAAIAYTDTLAVNWGWGDSTYSATVVVAGIGYLRADIDSLITIVPQALDFGPVRIGTSQTRSFYITNTSDTTRMIGVVADVEGSFALVGGAGPFSLAAGETRQVSVRFTPTGIALERDSVMVTFTRVGQLDTMWVPVTGFGTINVSPTATVLVQPSIVMFGNVTIGDSGVRTLTIINTSDTATVSGMVLAAAPGSAFTVTGGLGAFTLAAGDTHTVQIRFIPTAEGRIVDSLLIVYAGSTSIQPSTVQLSGTGVQEPGAPVLTVSPGALNFGTINVGATARGQVLITNPSATDTVFVTILNPSSPFFLEGAISLFALAPGDTHSVSLAFTPTVAGTFNENLVIGYVVNGTAGSQFVAISGSATAVTGIEDANAASRVFGLTAFSDPRSGQNTIRFSIPAMEHVRLTIYDTRGREVAVLVDDVIASGEHAVAWSAAGEPAGVYIVSVQTPTGMRTARINVVR